jgi:hypothetical protein
MKRQSLPRMAGKYPKGHFGRKRKYEMKERPVGRPTLYREGYADLVRKLRMCGLSHQRICEIFEVSPQTIEDWRSSIAEFASSWNEGGDLADGVVAHALYHRAKGYEHAAEKLWYDSKTGDIKRASYIEHYPPDVGAIELWLTNRQKDTWKKRGQVDINNPDGNLRPPPTLIFDFNGPAQGEILDGEFEET